MSKKHPISIPTYTKGEEIFNMTSHIVGGGIGVVATVLCVIFAALHHNVYGVVGSAIYGGTMIVLYTMSSIYHGLRPHLTAKKVFRVIDHCSVYLLIAGTYTPISLCNLREANASLGWTIFGIVWGVAALGITLNAIDLERFIYPSLACYLCLGWCVLGAAKTTAIALGVGGVTFLLLGGVAYSLGAVLYALGKKRKYIHSIFHIFVCLGSLFHFFCILFYVV